MPLAPVISEELAAFLQEGLSIAVGTRDANLAPEGARVWAVTVDPDRVHLEAFVYAPGAGPTLANLAVCPFMAVVFDRPHDNVACQVKGTFVASRAVEEHERGEIERQLANFVVSLSHLGIPAEFGHGARYWPALALRMRMTDVFRQNPGPGAGERMR